MLPAWAVEPEELLHAIEEIGPNHGYLVDDDGLELPVEAGDRHEILGHRHVRGGRSHGMPEIGSLEYSPRGEFLRHSRPDLRLECDSMAQKFLYLFAKALYFRIIRTQPVMAWLRLF